MTDAEFLARTGYADLAAVPGDASARTYARVRNGPRTAILMRTTPADAAVFAGVALRLARAGLSGPAIIDAADGLLLLEDFFDATLGRCLARADAVALYAAAGRTLARLQRVPVDGLPAWDTAAMVRTAAASFAEWWWPSVMDGPAPREAVAAALTRMLRPLGQRCAVHRDYFADNLMWLPGRHGVRRIGILDFQDFSIGHPAYDLVSLVEDSRREIPPAARDAAIAAYREAADPADNFEAAMAICAAQRHLRVAGLWVRLAVRDGRPAYLAHAPRTWALLERALAHPACGPLAEVLDRIPAARRPAPAKGSRAA